MKNIHSKILVVFILFLLFGSCQSNDSPKIIAEKFLKAFGEKKFDEAKIYCTPETIKLIEIAESLSKMSTAKVDFTGKEYEVLSDEIDGQTAKVKFREKGSEEVQLMMLKFIGNRWLVYLSKEDVMSKQNTDNDFKDNTDSINDTLKSE